MKTIREIVNENRGLVLLSVNIILILGIFFFRDPFGIFEYDYSNSKPWLESKEIIHSIKIERIQNGEIIYKQKLNPAEKSSTTHLVWNMEQEGKTYRLSSERMDSLIQNIKNLRKFTYLGEDSEKFKMNKNYFHLGVETKDREVSFRVGLEASKEGESYIQDDTGKIYLVPFSLSNSLGRQNPNFLLEKKIFPADLNWEDVITLGFKKGGRENYRLGRESLDWYKLGSENQKMEADFVRSRIQSLLSWEARSVHLNQKKDWKRTTPIQMEIGIAKKETVPRIFRIQCEWEDEESNTICRVSDREAFFALDTYAIEGFQKF